MVTFKYHSPCTTLPSKKLPAVSLNHIHIDGTPVSHSNSLLIPTFLFLSLSLGLSKLLFYVFFLTTRLLISNHDLAVYCDVFHGFILIFFKGGERFLSFFFHYFFVHKSFVRISDLYHIYVYNCSNCLCFARFVFFSLVSLHSLSVFPLLSLF